MAEQDPLSTSVEAVSIWQAVHRELRRALLSYADLMPPTLIQMGKHALAGKGKGKVTTDPPPLEPGDVAISKVPRWPLCVILSYQAASQVGHKDMWAEAVPAAVAVEIAMAAADLLDEIADEDPSPVVEQYGQGQALNTANLMLVMAQQILLRHAREEEGGGDRALAALAALQEMLVRAAVGQHLDMLYDRMAAREVTPEMSVRMTELKAGALISGACRIGAIMSGAEEEVVDLLTRFGRELGGIAQLQNDIQDVLPRDAAHEAANLPERKTDVRLRKRTVPIVFTLRDDSPEPNALQRAFSQPASEPVDEEVLRHAIVDAGGVQFARLLIDVHRENIGQIVQELEALRPGASRILAPLFYEHDEPQDNA
jgi:geranylgeranyl diphosphate synthase type I